MVASLLAIETLWQRELVRFWRQKSRVLGVVASPLIFWVVIGFGSGPNGPKLFFPGTVVLTVLFSAIFSTMSIIEDRREGFLLSMLVSPASRTSLVLGKILGSATLAWMQGMVILAFAPLAGIDLSLGELAPLAGIVFLISFTLTALGFLIAWKFDSTQGYHAVMNLLLLPMWMLSGAILDRRRLHVDSRSHAGESPHLFDSPAAADAHARRRGRIAWSRDQSGGYRDFWYRAAGGVGGARQPEKLQ
jgi:ABC-2 type transport system permease protein